MGGGVFVFSSQLVWYVSWSLGEGHTIPTVSALGTLLLTIMLAELSPALGAMSCSALAVAVAAHLPTRHQHGNRHARPHSQGSPDPLDALRASLEGDTIISDMLARALRTLTW